MLVVGLEPRYKGGRSIAPLGKSSRRLTHQSKKELPTLLLLGQERSINHEHRRGSLRPYQKATAGPSGGRAVGRESSPANLVSRFFGLPPGAAATDDCDFNIEKQKTTRALPALLQSVLISALLSPLRQQPRRQLRPGRPPDTGSALARD